MFSDFRQASRWCKPESGGGLKLNSDAASNSETKVGGWGFVIQVVVSGAGRARGGVWMYDTDASGNLAGDHAYQH